MKLEVIDSYCTGNFATVGTFPQYIEVETLPTRDRLKLKCYKVLDMDLPIIELDSDKYNAMVLEQQEKELDALKIKKIEQSKNNLKEFLKNKKIVSSCHGGIEKKYSITSEKQSHIASVLLAATIAEQNNIEYNASWNASGEPCTYDWTLKELRTLAMEIESMVRPFIMKQQYIEVAINEAKTIEEVNAISVVF